MPEAHSVTLGLSDFSKRIDILARNNFRLLKMFILMIINYFKNINLKSKLMQKTGYKQ